MKTDGETQRWARKAAKYVLAFVAIGMVIISISVPFVEEEIANRWFKIPNLLYLMPIPTLTAVAFYMLWKDLSDKARENRPFLLTLAIFLLGYIGFGISLYPWIVPFEFTIWEAAAVSTSQSIVLIGTVILLPVILVYTGYCYYIFRGKSSDEAMY